MSGKQRRSKKNKVPNGIWRWVCLPSAEADALLFLEKRGVESLASPRGLPSTQLICLNLPLPKSCLPLSSLSGPLNSTQVASRSSYTSTYPYSTNTMPVTVTGLHLVIFCKGRKLFVCLDYEELVLNHFKILFFSLDLGHDGFQVLGDINFPLTTYLVERRMLNPLK